MIDTQVHTMPVFLNPPKESSDPRERLFFVGQQSAFLTMTPEEARAKIKPQIMEISQTIDDVMEREDFYVELWEAFWDGYNAISDFEKNLKNRLAPSLTIFFAWFFIF